MLEKLNFIESKYEELSIKISDPAVMANQKEWQKLCKEHADLEDVVVKYREYKKVQEDIEADKGMLREDLDKELKEMVQEEIKDLTWADEDSEVEDIQASTLTNVIYVKVARSGGKSSIYWINIMNEMKKINTKAYLVGETAILYHEDKLLYEDATYHKIYATNMEDSIDIDGVKDPRLLGVDSDDNAYIGSMENGKITKIYYGLLENPTSKWNVIHLSGPVDKNNIYISEQGKVMINDNLKGTIKEVSTGKETSYKGKFLQVYSTGVASIKDGKLIKTNFK